MRFFCKNRTAVVLLIMLSCSVVFFSWRHFTRPEPWSDVRDFEGAIYSLATGKSLDVGEIAVAAGFLRFGSEGYSRVVCCHEVKTGRILWENRDAGYTNLKGLQVHVAIDSAGDVILTSHMPPSLHAVEATVAKLAGSTGSLVWETQLQTLQTITPYGVEPSLLERPVIGADNNVWQIAPMPARDSSTASILVLDGREGKRVFQHGVNASLHDALGTVGYFLRPAQIECLNDGGGIVFAVDGTDRQHAFRFSSAGKLLGQLSVRFPGNGSVEPLDFRRFVDERHRRINMVKECRSRSCAMKSELHVHLASFSLDDSVKLWESNHQLNDEEYWPPGHLPELAVIRPDGDLELRYKTRISKKKLNWLRWSSIKGIPLPDRTVVEETRLTRTIVSGANGSIATELVDSYWKSWFEIQATEAETATRETFVFSNDYDRYSRGRVRCPDSRRWLTCKASQASTDMKQCFRMVRTPSGRTVMSRDPNDRRISEPIRHWHLLMGR